MSGIIKQGDWTFDYSQLQRRFDFKDHKKKAAMNMFLEPEFKKFAMKVTREAKRKAPVRTGRLRNNLYEIYEKENLIDIKDVFSASKSLTYKAGVGGNTDYTRVQEQGMETGKQVPLRNLVDWARYKTGSLRSGFALAKHTQKKIRREGLKAKRFMNDALEKIWDAGFEGDISTAIEKAIKKMFG